MSIQHKDIADAQRHEPKGASTATSGSVYVSNGSGSGVWETPKIEGQAAAPAGSIPIKGVGGVSWQTPVALNPAYCEVDVAESIRTLTLNTEVVINGAFIDDFSTGKFVLTSGETLTVVETGVYVVHWSAQLKPQTSVGGTNETIEMRIKVNGVVTNPYRITPISVTRNAAVDDPFIAGGNRIIDLSAGDVIDVTLKNLSSTRNYKTQINYNLHRIA